MKCEDCEHWRRYQSHNEIVEQANWGDCSMLDQSELINPDLDFHQMNAVDCEFDVSCYETRKDFGCVLFKEREKS